MLLTLEYKLFIISLDIKDFLIDFVGGGIQNYRRDIEAIPVTRNTEQGMLRGVPGLFGMLRQFSSYMERLLKCWVSTQ